MKYINKFFWCMIVLFSVASVNAMDADLGGQHRVRWVYYDSNLSDVFVQRFKLTGDFRPNEMFESHFWLINNHQWGQDNDNVRADSGDIRIYGYGDWKVMDEVMIRVGRSPFQIADGSSVGVNDYENFPSIWDGGFVTYNTESVILDVWFAHLPGVARGIQVQQPFGKTTGLSLSVRSLPEFFKNANLFALYAFGGSSAVNSTTGLVSSDADSQYRVGLSLGGSYSLAHYKLSGAVHGATLSGMQQYFADALLGWKMSGVGVHGRVHYESDEYDPFYYTRHAQSGLLDIAEWGNGAKFYELGVSYMPADDFELGVNTVYFSSFSNYGQWNDSSVQLNNQDVAEAVAYVKKSYSGGFSVELNGGYFDVLGDQRYLQVQCNTSFDF